MIITIVRQKPKVFPTTPLPRDVSRGSEEIIFQPLYKHSMPVITANCKGTFAFPQGIPYLYTGQNATDGIQTKHAEVCGIANGLCTRPNPFSVRVFDPSGEWLQERWVQAAIGK